MLLFSTELVNFLSVKGGGYGRRNLHVGEDVIANELRKREER